MLEHLADRLTEADTALRHATGEEVFRAQGRALAYEDLIEDITGAPKRLALAERAGIKPQVNWTS